MTEGRGLHILTWNINGLETRRLDSRMEKVAMELVLGMDLKDALAGKPGPPTPEVVCLQEVVRRAHVSKLRPHLSAAGFALYPEEPPRDEGEYTLIGVRAPWRLEDVAFTRFEESPLGRGWLEARLADEAGRSVRVLTAHMESLRSGADARVAQALELDARMHDGSDPAIFAGDTNLRAAEWSRAKAGGLRAADVFELAGAPARYRDTWWPEESTRGYRFDRIWVDDEHAYHVDALRTRRRSNLSDHAPLEVRLSWPS